MDFVKRTTYERLPNGADVYMLKTPVKDVVVTQIALPGGYLALRDTPIYADLLTDLLPFGMQGKKKAALLDALESMGAQVNFSMEQEYLCMTLVTRKEVFLHTLSLLFTSLVSPSFETREWKIAKTRVVNAYRQAKEDTKKLADRSLRQQLYGKKHPLWVPSVQERLRAVDEVSFSDVKEKYQDLIGGTGVIVAVVGDIHPKTIMPTVREVVGMLPSKKKAVELPRYKVNDIRGKGVDKDVVVPVHDKENVHCVVGVPLAVTYEDSDFLPLSLGVHVLGTSTTSRLFETLRVKQSLTYGSYASLVGYGRNHPGFLYGVSIFPREVYARGKESMLEIFTRFAQKGVTKKELQEHAEEVLGSYAVGLASTRGRANVLFNILKTGKSLAYLDSYPKRISEITVSEVNKAIGTHVAHGLLKTASAGGVQKNGKPL